MAIKYVRATGGSDANNGLSFATAWATINYALATAPIGTRITAGDTLAVCGDTVSNVFTFSNYVQPILAALPVWGSPVLIKGYDMSGNPLTNGNFVKITASSAIANGLFLIGAGNNVAFFKFSNILFDGGGSGGAYYALNAQTNTTPNFTFDNCRFTNCAYYGVISQTQTVIYNGWKFLQCEFDNNGKAGSSGGLQAANGSTGGTVFMTGCKVHDNNGFGVLCADCSVITDNLIYKNAGDGLTYTGAGSVSVTNIIENNVFFGNLGDGLEIAAASYPISIVNNIFRSNGQYGIRTNTADVDTLNMALCANNCSHNNTSGHIDINGGVFPGIGHIYKNPLFVSESAGSEDFNLQATSPCRSAGYNPLRY